MCWCGAVLLNETEKRQLDGPQGWLTLFRFGLFVGQPLIVLLTLTVTLGGALTSTAADRLRAMPVALMLVSVAVYGVYVGVLLTRRRPSAVTHARVYLAYSLFVLFGVVAVVGINAGANEAGRTLGQSAGGLLVTVFWLRYFGRSRRVLVTYGSAAVQAKTPLAYFALAAVSVVLFVALPTVVLRNLWPATDSQWLVYAPVAAGFRVELPGAPSITKEPVTLDEGRAFVVTTALLEASDNIALSVSHFEYPADLDLSNSGAALDAIRDASVSPIKGVFDSRRDISIGDVPGREYVAHSANGQVSVTGRVYLDGHRGYTLVAATPRLISPLHAMATDRFLSSFSLEPR